MKYLNIKKIIYNIIKMIYKINNELNNEYIIIIKGLNKKNKSYVISKFLNYIYFFYNTNKKIKIYSEYDIINDSYKNHNILIINNKNIDCINFNKNINNNLISCINHSTNLYISNLHSKSKVIYLSRHGQSEYNTKNLIGGNSNITNKGIKYSKKLGEFLLNENIFDNKIKIWTSSLKRTNQTLDNAINNIVIKSNNKYTKNNLYKNHKIIKKLDEINAGIFDGYTYDDIKNNKLNEYESRKNNKLEYRYPEGESYLDLIQRIQTIINDLEYSNDPIVIISHNAIIRLIVGFYKGINKKECPFIEIPLHTVIKITIKYNKININYINLEK